MDNKKALKQLNELKKLGKKPESLRLAAEAWASDFETLISTILSSRTRDEVTIPVAEKLFKKYPNAKKLAKANISEIKKLIRPINFYNNKAKNIINCSKVLVKTHDNKIPRDINELLKLPGVGRKTANVFLNETGQASIGIDTHVTYISKKLGWTSGKNQEQIEKDLKKIFPRKYWSQVNETLVRFGKTHTSRKEKDKLLERIKNIK